MLKTTLSALLVIATAIQLTPAQADEIIPLKYDAWTIQYNCTKRGYESFHYKTVPDTGNLERYEPFHKEQRLPKRCQQFTTKWYALKKGTKQTYDRGHGVHQNIFDHDKQLMKASNSFANIVPQAKMLNRRGVWRKTEILTECYRDIGTVEVWGGNIWGDDRSNDHFIRSHGVVTPDQLWKVIKFPNGEVNAWLMPNSDKAKGSMMDVYLVAPATLERLTGQTFNISRQERSEKDSRSMVKPKYCSIK